MARIAKIHNVSETDIQLQDGSGGTVSVPAFGYASVPYDIYIAISVANDLGDYRLKVDIAQETVKKASATDFGAKGNGLDNDTRAIQRAVDYIAAYGGGVVDIPVGVYAIDGISVRGDVVLRGESREDSVFKMKRGGNTAAVVFTESGGGIDGIKVIGPSGTDEKSVGLSADACPSLSVANCSFEGVSECLHLGSGSQVVVENCLMVPKRFNGALAFYGFDEGSDSSVVESFCSYE